MSSLSACVKSILKLKAGEVEEISALADKLAAADKTLSPTGAHIAAVEQLLEGLRPKKAAPAETAPAPTTAFPGMGNTKAITDRVAAEGSAGFDALLKTARTAGDITAVQAKKLRTDALENMTKAKDDLMTLRQDAAEKRAKYKDAAAEWDGPEYRNEGDPKFEDLTPESQKVWALAHAANKASGDVYDKVLALQPKGKTAKADSEVAEGKATVDSKNPKLQNAKNAAGWLTENATEPFLRRTAARIEPFIDSDTPIVYVNDKNRRFVPEEVHADFAAGALGVSEITAKGDVNVFFPEGKISETILTHELVHAATERGLDANSELKAEAQTLLDTVHQSLQDIAKSDANEYTQEAAKIFDRVVSNPGELLAYGLTSRDFRGLLDKLAPDGTILKDKAAPSLLDKFVDLVRRAIGLAKSSLGDLYKLLTNDDKLIFQTEKTDRTALDRLDTLLDRALKSQAETPNGAQIPRTRRATADEGQTPRKLGNVPGTISIPEFEPQNKLAKLLRDSVSGWQHKPAMLGMMTMRQLADTFGKKSENIKAYGEVSAQLGAKAKAIMGGAHKIDQGWALVKDATDMHRMMIESTLSQMWPNKSFDSQPHLMLKDTLANRAKHKALADRYANLSEDARRVYLQAEAKMRADWDERGRLLKQRITDIYAPELSQIDVRAAANASKEARQDYLAGLGKKDRARLRSMFSDLDEHAERLAQMQGPYFPLMRFGEHVVVAKSADLNGAADSFEKAQAKLKALNADDESTDASLKAARDEVKNTQGEMDRLKDSEDHYLVEFYESPSDARNRVEQLQQHFAKDDRLMAVRTELRAEHFAKIDAVSPSFMNKLESSLSANLADKDANAIRSALRDLYIQNMPERSALKSELRRVGVKGVKANEMRRAFAAASMRAGWHLSRLEFGDKMNSILGDLREGNDTEKVIGNEFAKRLIATLQPSTSNLLLDRISALSYFNYLGFSPSFFVINSLQPWAISMPVMAGRHGVARSTAELGKAFLEVAAAMKNSMLDQKTWRFELDLEKFQDPNEHEMLNTLWKNGIIDVTLEHDLGSTAAGKDIGWVGKTMDMASLPAHHTEVVNRVMTALAAYRLATKNGLGEQRTHAAAMKYAEQIVADTHLDYTPENAPRFMRSTSLGGLGRVVFQFKKYTQGMVYLMAKMGIDAAKGDKEALKGFAYLMGTTLALSGASGLPTSLPIAGLAQMISFMYPDDDKPEFFLQFYKALKNTLGETAARALVKGLPAAAGFDLSSRLSLGQGLNPLAFMPQGKEGSDEVAAILYALAGPAASLAGNYAQAFVTAKDDVPKAFEQALPRFLADPVRAIDRYNRGVISKRGQTLIAPEEFGPLGIAMRAVGFESTNVTDMYDTRGAFFDARNARDTARNRLLRENVEARQGGGNTESVQSKTDAFNERHPDDRITGSNISSATKARAVSARSLKEGVAIRKQDRALAEKLGVGQ